MADFRVHLPQPFVTAADRHHPTPMTRRPICPPPSLSPQAGDDKEGAPPRYSMRKPPLLLHRAAFLAFVFVLPVPLLLQGIRNFFRHVGFVVLGKHVVGLEDAGAVERPFRYNALPLAEQIRQ